MTDTRTVIRRTFQPLVVALLIAAGAVSAQTVAAARSSGPVLGTWAGTASQFNDAGARTETWPLTMYLHTTTSAAIAGNITYPSLGPCGGPLTLLSSSDGTYSLKEHITYGVDKCIDGGTITIALLDANTIRWRWSKPGSGVHASATLTRTSSGQPAMSSQQAYLAAISKLLRVHTPQRYGFVVGLAILPFQPAGANDAPALLSQLDEALSANTYGCVSRLILKFVRTVSNNARIIADGEEALKIAVKLGLAELEGPASKIANQVVKRLHIYAPFAALQRLNAPIQVWNLVSSGAIGFCAA